MTDGKKYGAENIAEGEASLARKSFDVVELSKKIKHRGDRVVLSQEIHLRPRIVQYLKDEGRILGLLPDIPKSHAGVLARLRTDREVLLFSKLHDVRSTSARKLIKLINEWHNNLQNNPRILLSKAEHDLIIGSLMGDASIRQREKNSCFRVAHSFKQREYITWKLRQLSSMSITEFVERKRLINNREVFMIYLSTKTHPVFNYYRNLFYKNGRKIVSKDILNQLTPQALAVWICDDGSYDNSQGYIVICTNAYSFEEHKLMKGFFNQEFGLDPTIGFRDGKYYYLRFKQGDSKKLIEIIKPFIPESMFYKIGEIKHG